MSTINTQLGQGGYYSLQQSSTSGNNAQGAGRSASGVSLIRGGRGVEGAGVSQGNDAYLLDLSPEAQAYLRSLKNGQSNVSGNVSNDAVEQGFTVNSKQRLAIAAILEKYKQEPYTQEVFDRIQDELHQAGLSPDQLAAKYRASSFSTTAALVDALNGGEGSLPGSSPVSDSELQQRTSEYVQFIVEEWKKISDGTAEEAPSDAVSAVGSAGNAS